MSTFLTRASVDEAPVEGRAPSTRLALGAARGVGVVHALLGLAGVVLFTVVMPEEALWVHPVVDTGVVVLKVAVSALLLVGALWPGLAPDRRHRLLGFAVLGSVVFGLVKLTVYDEQEALAFFVIDALLVVLLVLARPRART
ncbi:hypothetical protein LL946_13755 [Knoellia locipacati]|uniref:hypothetical protein n=1 Tax=Knoellia locipacati TaxID=882824 RepID=UPI00384C0CE8